MSNNNDNDFDAQMLAAIAESKKDLEAAEQYADDLVRTLAESRKSFDRVEVIARAHLETKGDSKRDVVVPVIPVYQATGDADFDRILIESKELADAQEAERIQLADAVCDSQIDAFGVRELFTKLVSDHVLRRYVITEMGVPGARNIIMKYNIPRVHLPLHERFSMDLLRTLFMECEHKGQFTFPYETARKRKWSEERTRIG